MEYGSWKEWKEKYHVSEEQIKEVLEREYGRIIREEYKEQNFFARLQNDRLYIYHFNDNPHDAVMVQTPKSNSSITRNLQSAVHRELTKLQHLNDYEFFKDKVDQLFELKIKKRRDNEHILVDVCHLDYKYTGDLRLSREQVELQVKTAFPEGTRMFGILNRVNVVHDEEKGTLFIRDLVFENHSEKFMYAFLHKMIPYIESEVITIEKIARIPGYRTKVVVSAGGQSNLNAAGMCIGKNGEVVNKLRSYLAGEHIDFINEGHDLFSKLRSYCRPYRVIHVEFLNANLVKIVVEPPYEKNKPAESKFADTPNNGIGALVSRKNQQLLKKLLFDEQINMSFLTREEYETECQQRSIQLKNILIEGGVNEIDANEIASQYDDLNDLVFAHTANISEETKEILNHNLEYRCRCMLNKFVEAGGDKDFFEYIRKKCTHVEFMELQSAGILNFKDLATRYEQPFELAQALNIDTSLATILLMEVKEIYGMDT